MAELGAFIPAHGLTVAGNEAHQSVVLSGGAQKIYLPAGAGKIMMQALAQNVRYTLNGGTPTATVGFQLKAGDPPLVVNLKGVILTVILESAGAILQYELGD